MTGRTADPVAAWLGLQSTLTELAAQGYRVPCLHLSALFVSDDKDERQQALPWCQGCPARTDCHEYAEAANEPVYVWGGVDRAPRYRGGHHPRPKRSTDA